MAEAPAKTTGGFMATTLSTDTCLAS